MTTPKAQASVTDNDQRTRTRSSHATLEVNGTRHPLRPPGLVVGRGTEADLRINDPGVSRRHLELEVSIDGVEAARRSRNQRFIGDGLAARVGGARRRDDLLPHGLDRAGDEQAQPCRERAYCRFADGDQLLIDLADPEIHCVVPPWGGETAIDMVDLLTNHQGLSRNDAYSLMSIAADFGVTQVVDGTQGIHVRIDRRIFPEKGVAKDQEYDGALEVFVRGSA